MMSKEDKQKLFYNCINCSVPIVFVSSIGENNRTGFTTLLTFVMCKHSKSNFTKGERKVKERFNKSVQTKVCNFKPMSNLTLWHDFVQLYDE